MNRARLHPRAPRNVAGQLPRRLGKRHKCLTKPLASVGLVVAPLGLRSAAFSKPLAHPGHDSRGERLAWGISVAVARPFVTELSALVVKLTVRRHHFTWMMPEDSGVRALESARKE